MKTCAFCRHWRGDASTYRGACAAEASYGATTFDQTCDQWTAQESPSSNVTPFTRPMIYYFGESGLDTPPLVLPSCANSVNWHAATAAATAALLSMIEDRNASRPAAILAERAALPLFTASSLRISRDAVQIDAMTSIPGLTHIEGTIDIPMRDAIEFMSHRTSICVRYTIADGVLDVHAYIIEAKYDLINIINNNTAVCRFVGITDTATVTRNGVTELFRPLPPIAPPHAVDPSDAVDISDDDMYDYNDWD
jgi:hypothetical protein